MPFITELDENRGKHSTIDLIKDQVQKKAYIQGLRNDMHFEINYCNGLAIGLRILRLI